MPMPKEGGQDNTSHGNSERIHHPDAKGGHIRLRRVKGQAF